MKKIDNVFSEEEKEVNSGDVDIVDTTVDYLAKCHSLEEKLARDARISEFV